MMQTVAMVHTNTLHVPPGRGDHTTGKLMSSLTVGDCAALAKFSFDWSRWLTESKEEIIEALGGTDGAV